MSQQVKVVLADSDECVSLRLQAQLSEQVLRYEIRWVQTALQLESSLRDEVFDVCLVSDDIATALTFRPARTSFVILTEEHEQGAERATQLGAHDYLSKHQLDVDTIERTIRYALDRKRSETRMSELAHIDQLTGLPNRNHFQKRMTRCIDEGEKNRKSAALLIINIDRFRVINDVYGHQTGDAVLKVISDRITSFARTSEDVARLSGDEFTILLHGEDAAKDAVSAARTLQNEFVNPISLTGCAPKISCSIGITVFPSDGNHFDQLMRNADAALTAARSRGLGNYQSYSNRLGQGGLEKHSLEARLHKAVAQNEFSLHYQPQMDLASNQVVGLEALLRWNEPGGQMMSPARFVPILEETGLIVPVGEWVLRTACAQQLVWKKTGLGNIRMGVNVSAVQFAREDLLETVTRALEDYPLDSRKLELEITEGFLIDDIDQCRRTLEKLRNLGVRIAIDDFGTGYSSLVYLRRFPIDVLKIDRTFVRDVGEDSDATAIVSAIIALAHKLQIEVIAEGVETEAQRDFLRGEGCEVGQGYLFSPPLPAVWQSPRPETSGPIVTDDM